VPPGCFLLMPALLAIALTGFFAERASAAPCDPPIVNAIACENSKPGNPPSEWDVNGSGDSNIQGFATDISVDQGQTVNFKVKTPSSDYRLDIYRMGYYGGNGARKVATVQPSASLPQSQPACLSQSTTGLVDCGNWSPSASWTVPADAVSGIYFAKLEREDVSSDGSHIIFVVRDDDGHSNLLFQTSDTTWQAYNRYGGNSLYVGGPGTNPGRAYKVSYNRPLTVRGTTSEDSPFNAEYPMVRWLERNGYDVSYSTGIDTDRRGAEILEHKTFLSVGHDEYWSSAQRANVEAARAAGVNLAFFSGNEIFWKTRWENSIDGSNTDHRTLVCYKETHADARIDPTPTWTGTWRDPRFSPPADGGRPENSLSGTAFMVNAGTTAIQVPAADGKMRFWRNTSVASLAPNQTATLSANTLGYEWDEDLDNGSRPAGLIDLSSTTASVPQRLLDYGSSYGSGNATHRLTLYRSPSGALVFGAGTIQWSWGLDGNHDREASTADSRMQQATVNLLADMGAQAATLQAGLVAAAQTTDKQAPATTITSPLTGAEVRSGTPITISGTATDQAGETEGGQVGGVEVSVDGGSTWHPAVGRDNWTYSWTPGATGSATIRVRAADDSGNLESPGAQVAVSVVPPSCPCSIWDSSFTGPEDADKNAVEVGTKFRSDVAGFVTGVRFYKTSGNTGTHIGRLWTVGGTQLAQATFTAETATGWQQVNFGTPVAIAANTTYIVSYHAPNGHYSSLPSYFSLVGVDNPPLHALANGADGPNGVYKYGAPGSLFSGGGPSTFNSEGYLVDVAFNSSGDVTPPTIISRTPANGASAVPSTSDVTATFSQAMDPTKIDGSSVFLQGPGGSPVAATVSYSAAQQRVTLDPTAALQGSTTYTATIKGGPGGVADLAGNPLSADSSWSFATAAPAPPPPDEGPGGPILVISNAANLFSRYYAEILRAEGLNEFKVTDLANVTPAMLGGYDVAILGEVSLSGAQVTTLSDWVQQGGNLIAMRPDPQLSTLLGLADTPDALANGYLKVDTATGPGAGIVGETIQFHGTADRYATSGAQTIATLYAGAGSATTSPAVTLRSVGPNGGQAAAFTYDLAKSVVYTRQGNPAWAGDERDGMTGPIRSDDLFFGAKQGDVQPDWVDLSKVAIPQADEQQRLLKNLIEEVNLDRKPLPGFWFLPRDEKAAVVMSGDDHGHGGTVGRFDQYIAASPPGCVVADWECVRGTSYIYPSTTPLSSAQATAYQNAGFEIALHQSTNCNNWEDRADLESLYTEQLTALAANYPDLRAPTTNRTHCITWSDWATQPKVELQNGIRLDTNYYYWPEGWVQNRPGMFTGSGMPMRFADLDGSMIDVYQAATQMTDESGQTYPFTIDSLLNRALGPEGYYGVFTANMHTDNISSPGSDAIVSSALARGVPVVSADQMLTWLDGRNNSSFSSIAWNSNKLTFTIDHAAGANGLRAMVPTASAVGTLTGLKQNGVPVATITRTVKGREYAFFDAASGSYEATYAVDDTAPAISKVAHAIESDGTATITWDTSEISDSRVDFGTDPDSLSATVSGSTLVTSHGLHLTGLSPGTTYHYRVTSADAAGNSGTDPAPAVAPRTFTTPEQSFTDTTVADFTAGSLDANTRIWQTGDGELILRPTEGDEFSGGPGLPTGWASCPWTTPETCAPGTGGTVSGGSLRVNGSYARTVATYGSGRSLEFVASFGAQTFQHAGFGIDLNKSANWAIFSVQSNGTLAARTNNNGAATVTQLSSALLGSPHLYRIEWGATDVRYYVDGSLVATHTASFGATQMRPIASDLNAALPELSVDWLRMSAYPGSATFNSRVFDAGSGASADWRALSWNASTPSGTEVALSVRTGDTATPDESWTAFSPIAVSGGDIPGSSRYLQYRAQLTTTNPAETPTLSNVSIAYSSGVVTPQTTIDSGPSGETNDSTPTFTFHSSAAGSAFTCSIDTGTPNFVPCSGPGASHTPASPLPNGSYTFRVRATFAGDTDPTPATSSITINVPVLNPPNLTGTSPASPANANSLQVLGSAEAGSQVLIYSSPDCSGVPLATGTAAQLASPGITISVLDDSTTALRATAIDGARTSVCSGAVTYIEDSTGPNTTISSGPSGPTNDSTPTFGFSSSEQNSTFQCRFDSAEFAPCSGPGATHTPTAALSAGAHTFSVRAVDQIGNVGATPATRSFTVDTQAPNTTISSGPTGTTSPTPTFGFSSSEQNSTFQCRFDSAAFAPCSGPGATHTPSAPLSGGSHTFAVRAVDQAGNTDATPATRSFTVDATAPNTTISSGPSGGTTSPTPTFGFSSSEQNSTFQCRFDSAAFAPCSGTGATHTPTAALSEGAHTFSVRAVDQFGNIDATPATRSFSVDTLTPDTTITSGPSGTTTNRTATFAFSSSEAGGTFQCRLDGANFASCSSPKTYLLLSFASHTFQVRAIDGVGNVDPTPAVRTFTVTR
jgi:N,N-dimethylformamidase beta subunit-like, C-terminal/Domain of unknown function (DUF4082)/Bacterial Ig-like domain/Bacterial Ig domain/Purple acid Phosphatase, N-terminal domain